MASKSRRTAAERKARFMLRNNWRYSGTPKVEADVYEDLNGDQVAELLYLETGEIERISAPTERALALKLLEMKGNATLEIREAVQQRKLAENTPRSRRNLHGFLDTISPKIIQRLFPHGR